MTRKKSNRATLTQELKDSYTQKLIGIKSILMGITNRSRNEAQTNTVKRPFDDLYSLLCNKSLLIQALGNIEKNKGKLTPGVDAITIDSMSNQRIDDLLSELKSHNFRFSRTKRKWIPKLKLYKIGEPKKLRPLGIPTFKDRIVQEAIRIILEAIYEPIFEQDNFNFGFRPGYGCHHPILKIKREGPGLSIAIEGDIEGAYDNVDHNILINILEKKISDRKFLKLIYQGFKSGILDQGNKIDSISGVPQGGIASPILFNIYMYEFDHFIKTELQQEIDNINKTENRTKKPRYKEYDNLSTKISRIRNKYRDQKNNRKFIELNPSEQSVVLKLRKDLQSLIKLRQKMPSLRMDKREIKILYTRYADDWIILSNCKKQVAILIKEKIEEWLKTNLKLSLSPTKTKITNLKIDSAKFLGFSIRTYNKRRFTKNSYGELEKSAGWDLIVDIDKDRYLDKLVLKGFSNIKHKPIAKNPWTVLQPEEIITRFNYILRGIANYYLPVIDRLSYFQYLTYILKFSCLSTFAKKYKTKITNISKKYGDPLTIKVTQKISYQKLAKTSQTEREYKLLNYETLKTIKKYKKFDWKKSKFVNIPEEDLFKPMNSINWRTYKNLDNICCICGTDKDVQQHHIHHIRKGKVVGFAQVMKQLNRKTIPLCKTHHLEVHNHKYDDIKLSDLVGIERFII